MTEGRRDRQKLRTRRALLAAAARFLSEGRQPTVAEVAEAAEISRATAYRYFPTQDSLLAEAPIDGAVPTPEKLLPAIAGPTPRNRSRPPIVHWTR